MCSFLEKTFSCSQHSSVCFSYLYWAFPIHIWMSVGFYLYFVKQKKKVFGLCLGFWKKLDTFLPSWYTLSFIFQFAFSFLSSLGFLWTFESSCSLTTSFVFGGAFIEHFGILLLDVFVFNLLILCIWVFSFSCMHICSLSSFLVPLEVRRECQTPGNSSYWWSCGCCKSNLGPPHKYNKHSCHEESPQPQGLL